MTRSKSLIVPANPLHPGAMLLEEFLKPAGLTQAALAAQLGWTKARLLGEALGTPDPVENPVRGMRHPWRTPH